MDVDGLSKSQQKKLNKKLKADNGAALSVGSEVEEKEKEKKNKSKKEKKKAAAQDGPVKESESAMKEKAAAAQGDTAKESESTKKDLDAAGVVKTLEGGLKIKDATIGTGKQVKKGNYVSMRYIGKLSDGTVFDKNTSGKPVSLIFPPTCERRTGANGGLCSLNSI